MSTATTNATNAASSLPVSDEARTWKITTTNGITVYGYLPGWAEDDPSESGVEPRLLDVTLADIRHRYSFDDVTSPLITCDGDAEDTEGLAPFFCEIECHPHADREVADGPLVPVLNVQITPDCSTTCRETSELTALIADLRVHVDYLENDVLPNFVAVREDWAARHFEATGKAS
jgi:hypothetical protein